MEDSNFETLFKKFEPKSIYESLTLLIEIYKLIHHISPPIMRKLPSMNTWWHSILSENLFWNEFGSNYKNINILEEYKTKIKLWNPIIFRSRICK